MQMHMLTRTDIQTILEIVEEFLERNPVDHISSSTPLIECVYAVVHDTSEEKIQ